MKSRIRLVQRNRPVQRLRGQMKIHASTIVISALVLNLFFLTYSYLNLGVSKKAWAATMSAVASGDWTEASTWSLGRVPQSYDTLTIPAGVTVNVDVVTQEYLNMKIIVYGTLHFDGGKKVRMCDGIVDVQSGAKLLGDNHGSKIDICSVPVWTGDTVAIGPLVISGSGPLPVQLVYFNASPENKNVIVRWETASQVNCDYFSIERSSDGFNFQSIANIEGEGNSSQRDAYLYADALAPEGTSYYRLKQIDFDGASQTFNIVSVDIEPKPDITVYPNPIPAGSTATVQIPFEESEFEVSVMSMEGKTIYSKTFEKNTDGNNISFQTEALTAKGTFLLVVASGQTKTAKKIFVQ